MLPADLVDLVTGYPPPVRHGMGQQAGVSVLTPGPGVCVCAHLRAASGTLAGDFAAWAT